MKRTNKNIFTYNRTIELRISERQLPTILTPMKKILILLITAVVIASCSTTKPDDENSKRVQLQQYKQELHNLKLKIKTLENELNLNNKTEVVKVKVVELKTEPFIHSFDVTGKVEAIDDVKVNPESTGVITEVFVKEGQVVKRGTILAKLNTEILERSMDELNVQLELAKTNYDRQANLWKQNIGSEMQYLQAKNNKENLEKRIESLEAQLDLAEIKSPVSGVVDVVYQKKGNIGNPQMPFAKVVNISKIKIYADVSEFYLTKIKKGDVVDVSFPALNRKIKATINQIGNTIDPNNRTFRVRINLNNPDKMIKPNLVSIITLIDYKSENAISVPVLYIKDDLKGSYTYIVDKQNGKNTAKKVYVKTGVTNNNIIEITDGLKAGMLVVSEGYNQIKEGTVIQYQ